MTIAFKVLTCHPPAFNVIRVSQQWLDLKGSLFVRSESMTDQEEELSRCKRKTRMTGTVMPASSSSQYVACSTKKQHLLKTTINNPKLTPGR